MNSLPVELWDIIVNYLRLWENDGVYPDTPPDIKCLKNVRLTCRLLNDLAAPVFYERVNIVASWDLHRVEAVNPRRVGWIKYLGVWRDHTLTWGFDNQAPWDPDIHLIEPSKLTRLEGLSLSGVFISSSTLLELIRAPRLEYASLDFVDLQRASLPLDLQGINMDAIRLRQLEVGVTPESPIVPVLFKLARASCLRSLELDGAMHYILSCLSDPSALCSTSSAHLYWDPSMIFGPQVTHLNVRCYGPQGRWRDGPPPSPPSCDTVLPALKSYSGSATGATLLVPGRPVVRVLLSAIRADMITDDLLAALGRSTGPLTTLHAKYVTEWKHEVLRSIANHLARLQEIELCLEGPSVEVSINNICLLFARNNLLH